MLFPGVTHSTEIQCDGHCPAGSWSLDSDVRLTGRGSGWAKRKSVKMHSLSGFGALFSLKTSASARIEKLE